MTKLKEVMKEKGITQEVLSQRTGLSMTGCNNIINGKSSPKLESIDSILKAVDATFDEVFGK